MIRRGTSAAVILAFVVIAPAAGAKTALDSSEKTYARECIDLNASDEELIGICQQALDEGGYGRVQHLQILEALGHAYRWTRQFDEAEVQYRRILDLDPRSTRGLNGLGWVAYAREDFAAAAGHFEASVAVNPTNDGLGGFGGAGFRAGRLDIDTAVGYLDAALALNDTDRWTLREKGWILLDVHRYEAALAAFQAAIALEAEDANAHEGAARALAELQRYAAALTHILKAGELNPDDLDVLIWRSHISRWNGNNLRALRDAELVIRKAPELSDGVVLKARAQAAMGFDQLALTTLRDAFAEFENDDFLRYWLAEMLRRDEQFEEALAIMAANVAAEAPDGYDLKLYANLALELGRLDEARQVLERASEVAPWLVELGYYRARLLVLEGRYDDAEAAFAEAVEAGLPASYAADLAQLMIKQGEMLRAVVFGKRY
ncbi:tetratricopeptide repeat protein [Marimonas arenosa]|uniref:tetratricopeptide repeat protein n=1 Tax=Marimonas arenosa TaxID=1795305 RepID=UPI0027D2F26B|nr:tetratricopeptide repeat protein [Marimonas arenosa]